MPKERLHRCERLSGYCRMIAEDRSGEHVKQRRMIVEEIAILQQAGGPSPGDMQMLRFI